MKIAVVRDGRPRETRVAVTPATVNRLRELGYDVAVETGAGFLAGFPDRAYVDAGAEVGRAPTVLALADVMVTINAPSLDQLDLLKPGVVVVGLLDPAQNPELLQELALRGLTALALDAVPRISRAQSVDVLSSMANVAGYRAVVEAAHEFGRMFTGQVTAAGKTPPARVFVVGAGVAGLAAIGTASAMGAIVRAFDVRPEVAEQVESMGAQFVDLDPALFVEKSPDGYAKEMTEEQVAATAAMYDEEARAADIVITTALIPGRRAPKLLTAQTVAGMRSGSVIVDMAAANGGNATGTVTDQKVVTENGVTILGYSNLPGRLAAQSSQLYGTNVINLLNLLSPDDNGSLRVDLDDVVIRAITVAHGGEVLWPPPTIAVSVAPQGAVAGEAGTHDVPTRESMVPPPSRRTAGLVLGAIALFWLVNALAPTDELRRHFTVLMLSIVIGYYVVGKVAHALHTPLMSVTNAISGVVVVGALLAVAQEDTTVTIISSAVILLVSVNVFGGFAVTRRMLRMFSKGH